jgi:hypothetical protein
MIRINIVAMKQTVIMPLLLFSLLLITPALTFAQLDNNNTVSPSPPNGTITVNKQQSGEADIILVSQRYNDEGSADRIVGEVANNGTGTAEFVRVTASFYDQAGNILGSQFSYADPQTIVPAGKSPFIIFITTDAIEEDDIEAHDLILQWQDSDGQDHSSRVNAQALALLAAEGKDDDEEDKEKGNSNSDDNESDDVDDDYNPQLARDREWAKERIGNFDELGKEDQESAIDDVLDDVDEDILDEQREEEEGEDNNQNNKDNGNDDNA